ncbi:conjugative transposon protein TraM [Leeuwenhoekiella parthenopeia]|uniref:Conjugative transposon protein TraM n=1 Tax=Leeuwenhoekiella parthenopeia TaxID=2890320 RepID=A0ABS8GYY1_9FLAO|nr:conjugative transposon protein TraM [Leeuwenhoekiella parthenopeia]MCC4214402.1 conjugative transposon protein TraM [Leeuwenhoekiella parthenopeia]
MKIQKNKLVFASIIAVIIMFLVSYTMMLANRDQEPQLLKETQVPELEVDPEIYRSKLDAINALKEERKSTAPSVYNELLMDSLGYFDPEYPENQKQRIIDSIYASARINYDTDTYSEPDDKEEPRSYPQTDSKLDSLERIQTRKVEVQELGLEHQLFFAARPQLVSNPAIAREIIPVVVDGDQVVKANSRLRLRTTEATVHQGRTIPKNTHVFGFVSFQPNRVKIRIESIAQQPVDLEAFDLEDSQEGIYVENNFRAEATREVLDDLMQEVNIPGVPQVGGIGQILRRGNRTVKVTVLNNYKMLLKPAN